MKAPKYHMFTSRETQTSRYRQPAQEEKSPAKHLVGVKRIKPL